MQENGRRCGGVNARGEPCESPVIGEDGWCDAHRPGNEDTMKLRGQRGAEATRRRWLGKGLSPDELPALRTPRDAKTWAELAAQAVASGQLSFSQGQSIARLLAEWRAAYQAEARVRVAEVREAEQSLEVVKFLREVAAEGPRKIIELLLEVPGLAEQIEETETDEELIEVLEAARPGAGRLVQVEGE